jgi:hypothetical protein
MEQHERIGTDKVTVAEKRQQIVKQLASRPQVNEGEARTGSPARDRTWLRRWVGQRAATPESLILDMDGRFTPDGAAGEPILRDTRRAMNAREGEVGQFDDARAEAMKKAGYPIGTRKYSSFLGDREDVTLPHAGKLALTRSEQLGLYAMWKDPETQAMIGRRGRARFNFSRDRSAEPFEMTTADFDAIASRLTPTEKSLKDEFFDAYNKGNLRQRAVSAKYALSGYAPEPHDGYFPRRVNSEKTDTAGEPLAYRQAKRALEDVSQMEPRAQHDQVFVVPDFVRDSDKFIKDTATLIHLAKPVRIARMLLEHPETKAAVRGRYGPSVNGEIEKFLTNLSETPDPPTWDRNVANTINRGFYRANLTLNPRTFANNALGGTQMLMPMFDARDYFPALKDAFSPATHAEMIGASNIASGRWRNPLHEQYGSFIRTEKTRARLSIGEALKAAASATTKGTAKDRVVNTFESIGQAADAITLMNVADSAPFRVAWSAAKREAARLHPEWSAARKQEYVLDRFHDATMRTQNGMTPTETSGLWYDAKASAILKGLTFLKNDANKKLNLLLQAKHADAQTRAKVGLSLALNIATSSAVRVLFTGTAVGLLYRTLATGRGPNDLEKQRAGGNAAWKAVDDFSGLVPGGDLLTSAARAVTQGKDFSLDLPVARPAEDVVKGGTEMAQSQKFKHAKVREQHLRRGVYHLTNALRTFAGDPTLPLVPIHRRPHPQHEPGRATQHHDEHHPAHRGRQQRRTGVVQFAHRSTLFRLFPPAHPSTTLVRSPRGEDRCFAHSGSGSALPSSRLRSVSITRHANVGDKTDIIAARRFLPSVFR